jgi:hypothetical protein
LLGFEFHSGTKPGSGTTNDGNTARRFFENPSLSSAIAGIDEKPISRFGTIPLALPLIVKPLISMHDYGWYYMPASVHEILIHGAKIIEAAILPVAQLSEEAQEACNID